MFSFIKNLLILYLVSGLIALIVFCIFSYTAKSEIDWDKMSYNKAFTFHFFIMIFLFIVPAIPSLIKRSFSKEKDEYK
tara:strand:- start:69 stop:302 length:234 start_codon:yes stop_codon:yes gene_type:complete